MSKGRKPLPRQFHLYNGTDRPCRRNDDEPQPDISLDVPHPPVFLSKHAADEWVLMAAKLHKVGVLTEIDHSALALYCQAWGEFVDAQIRIYGDDDHAGEGFTLVTDKGNIVQNPLVGVSHRAMELAHKFLVEFGMTPSSRTRVKADKQKGKSGNKFADNISKQLER